MKAHYLPVVWSIGIAEVGKYLLAGACLLVANAAGSRTLLAQQLPPNIESRQPQVEPAEYPRKLITSCLPNAIQLHPCVISGGLPTDRKAFEELVDLGVTTIISVDGARPDVAAARACGLRYVHLPHGYDGISRQRANELAKAVCEIRGKIYIHCHHGKHRSPAAAAVACVSAGLLPPSAAMEVLELAGTSPHYRGLYQAASRARQISIDRLRMMHVDYQEIVPVPPVAEAMVAIEHTWGALQAMAEADWQPLKTHPDLEPIQTALLLEEHFTELLRSDYVSQRPEEFHQLLRDSAHTSGQLKSELIRWLSLPDGRTSPPPSLSRLSSSISANCRKCHQRFRDVPE